MSQRENEVIKAQIDDQLAKGNIRSLVLLAAAPVLIVKKPNGSLRVCLDYRGLNALTIKSRYPIPLIQETLNRILGKEQFTKLDVITAFNRIRVVAGDVWKIAFTTRYRQFECVVMPFSACNVPGTFQSYINDTLRDFLDDFYLAYLDDCLVFSYTRGEYIQYVRKVIQKLLDAGLQLDIKKYEFFVYKTKYLSMIIGKYSVRIDLEKVATVQAQQIPTYVKDVQAFLGFGNFYRKFISKFGRIVVPLTALTRKATAEEDGDKKGYVKFIQIETYKQAFQQIKQAFTDAPVLALYYLEQKTAVETDVSDYITAAVLSQQNPNTLTQHPVAFMSKKISPAKCNYEIYNKELLAIVQAFEEQRPKLIAEGEEDSDFERF